MKNQKLNYATSCKIIEFYGISVFMFWFDTDKHKLPHFHAKYGSFSAVFGLDGALIQGDLGPRGNKMIKEWAQEREADIREAWEQAVTGK